MNLQADLLVLLPELILAVGAMALLLTGAIGGEKTAPRSSAGAPSRCWRSAASPMVMGRPTRSAFHGAFVADGFARFAKILILIGAALSILLADEFFATIRPVALRIAGADAAGHPGHDADGVGVQLPVALYGAGAAEPGALCAGRLQPRLICAPPKRA